MNSEEREILEQAGRRRGEWNPEKKAHRKSYKDYEETIKHREGATKYKINDPKDPKYIPKNQEHATRKGFKQGWVSTWSPEDNAYYYSKGQESTWDINKALMPAPTLDRTEALDELIKKKGMHRFGKRPVSVQQQQQAQQRKSSTSDTRRGRNPGPISTPSVKTPRQRGFSPESRAKAQDLLREFKDKVPKSRADELREQSGKVLNIEEAPGRMQGNTSPVAKPTVVKSPQKPPQKPHGRVFSEDVKGAWSKQPKRIPNKEVFKKQFGFTDVKDVVTDKELEKRKKLNDKYHFNYSDEELKKIPKKIFYDQLEGKKKIRKRSK